jgi:hypothetical protein
MTETEKALRGFNWSSEPADYFARMAARMDAALVEAQRAEFFARACRDAVVRKKLLRYVRSTIRALRKGRGACERPGAS